MNSYVTKALGIAAGAAITYCVFAGLRHLEKHLTDELNKRG